MTATKILIATSYRPRPIPAPAGRPSTEPAWRRDGCRRFKVIRSGDVYFVKDGNHRVSVARSLGQEFIDAEVIELPITVPLTSDDDARDLLRLAEYARFLEQTKLDKLRPGVNIEFAALGRYDTLLEHISAHRWYMGINQHRRSVAGKKPYSTGMITSTVRSCR